MSGMTFSLNDPKNEFLHEAILLSQDLLTDMLFVINGLQPLTKETESSWNHYLSGFTSDLSKFVELTTLISKVITKHKNQTLPQIKESHIHLLFVIKAINQAQSKNDLAALEELIKYELKDNLTVWKIDLISQIKRLLNI